jgi:DNA polymerase-4
MPRKILHLDLDAFFCSVEEQRDPSLASQPFVVGGRPERRGVVASCSYAARRFGVHSAMAMAQAVRLYPGLVIVPADYHLYQLASERVMAMLSDVTPLVEQISIDEAFMDVSDMPEPGELIAHRLQETINQKLRLPCSLGVAANKLLAKIANSVGKARVKSDRPPNSILVVPPGQEATFLAPLPMQELWGVGPKMAARLAGLGIHTVGDLARWPEDNLVRRLGKYGHDLAVRARGIDDRPVKTEREARSISQETTFAEDLQDGAALRRNLRQLAEHVGRRLRRHQLSGTTIKIKVRWSDFTTLTRQTTLDHATDLDREICAAAGQLFEKTWPPGKPVRLIGVGVSSLHPPARQLGLWQDAPAEKDRRLQTALDRIRERFGDQAVQRASRLMSGRG